MEALKRAAALAVEALSAPDRVAARWRSAHGGAVIGHLPYDVPVELIHAAGMLPVGVFPAGGGFERSEAHLQSWVCSPARRFLNAALRGELDFLDGLIIPQICDTMRGLFGLWQYLKPLPFMENFLLPRDYGRQAAMRYLVGELGRLKARLEGFSGREISRERLGESMVLYNRLRENINRMFTWHVKNPALITNEIFYTLVRASLILPPEEMVAILEAIELPPDTERGLGSVPLVLSGKMLEPPGLARLLDAAGAVVTGDDLTDGHRVFSVLADLTLEPLYALAGRQKQQIPCAAISGGDKRGKYLLGLVARTGAQGVVFVHFKYCETENLGYPGLRRYLEERGVACLRLETQWGDNSLAPLETRLEAFLEMLGGV